MDTVRPRCSTALRVWGADANDERKSHESNDANDENSGDEDHATSDEIDGGDQDQATSNGNSEDPECETVAGVFNAAAFLFPSSFKTENVRCSIGDVGLGGGHLQSVWLCTRA